MKTTYYEDSEPRPATLTGAEGGPQRSSRRRCAETTVLELPLPPRLAPLGVSEGVCAGRHEGLAQGLTCPR